MCPRDSWRAFQNLFWGQTYSAYAHILPIVCFLQIYNLNWKGQTKHTVVFAVTRYVSTKRKISNLIKKPKASPKTSYFLGYKINLTFGAQRKEIGAEIHCETNSTDLWVGGSKDLWEAHYFWIKPLGTWQGGSLELISTGLPQKFPKFAEIPKASSDNLLVKNS